MARTDLHLQLVRPGDMLIGRGRTSATSGTSRSTCRRSCSWRAVALPAAASTGGAAVTLAGLYLLLAWWRFHMDVGLENI